MSLRARLGALWGDSRPLASEAGREVSRVVGIEVLDDRTALMCEGAGGPTTMLIPAAPTTNQAARWRRLVRVHHVDIVVDGPATSATLHGVGHRMPTRRKIPLSVGLALLGDGVAGNVIVTAVSQPTGSDDE